MQMMATLLSLGARLCMGYYCWILGHKNKYTLHALETLSLL